MVLKEVEPEKLRTLAELKIAPTAEHAAATANDAINQSKSDAQLKQLNLAASEYQKSENKLVAALGRAAEGLLKKNNLEDANLVLGMAELLTRSGELKPKYTEAWKHDFESYVSTFLKKIEKGLTDEDRKEALLTSAVVVNNIGNAARIEKLDYFSEKAQSPKWKESTRNFVTGAIEGIKALYEQEKFEEGDKALGYLDFFINTILKEGIKGNEGRTAVEQAVLLQLGGEREKAEEMFKKGLQQYGTTIVVRQLWEQYAKLESTYNMISDAYGKSEKAEGILAEAKNALDSRRVNVAVKKLNEFAEAINKHVKKNMLAKLDEIESDLKATSKVMEGYKEGLKQYVSEFPEQVKGIVKKIENVTSDSEILLNELKSVKKDYESGRVDEKKTEKFFLSLQKFSAEKKDVIGTVSTATLLFGNIKAYEQYVLALKMSTVDPARKGTAIESLNKATTNMKKSLELVIKEGSESKGAKEQYEKGIYNVIGAIALLDLERLPYQEEEKKLTFFKQGFTTIYDKCAKAEDTKDVWELNGTLHNGLRAVLATDDKLFATKEAGLQQDIMLLTKYLNNHYIAKITGKKEGLLSSATVKEYKDAVARDSETLAKKIEHAELINSLLKTAATFIPGFFPAVFTAMAVETAVKEYEITNKISWSTGLMLAASALAFRGAIGLGMETATLGAKIANTTLNVTEGMIGTTLAVHGGYSTYQMFKEGRYEEGIANMVMFALPLFHTAAKKPLMTYMGKKVPAFRRLTGEFVSEDAINTQLKKFGFAEMKELVKTELEKAKAAKEHLVRFEWTTVPGTLIAIPAVKKIKVEKPTVSDVLKRITTGNREQYVEALKEYNIIPTGKGKVAENFYETVKANSEYIKGSLKEIREGEGKLIYKDDYELYRALNNEMKEGGKTAAAEVFETGTGHFEFLILDKGKTWQLNNIGKEFGDLGLFIYFKAAKNLEKEFGIPAVRLTAEGDEILIIFTGKNFGKGKEYVAALGKEINRIATEMGLKGPLKDAITSFGAVEVKTVATLDERGRVTFTADLKGETKTLELNTILSTAEAMQKIEELEKLGVQTGPLLGFLELSAPKLEGIVDIENLPKEVKLDEFVSIRFDFEKGIKNSLWELTNMAGKGVSQVDNGVIGPSVLNLLGHPVTDALTAKYLLALQNAFDRRGLPITIYKAGPLTAGLRFAAPLTEKQVSAFNKAIEEARVAVKTDPELAAKGIKIENMELYAGKTKDEVTYKIAERVVGREMTSENYERMKQIVTVLHLNPDEMLAGRAFDKETTKLLKNVQNTKWVRNPEDLVHYLRSNGVSEESIIKLFEDLGVFFGEKTKKETMPPSPLKTVKEGEAPAVYATKVVRVGEKKAPEEEIKPAAPAKETAKQKQVGVDEYQQKLNLLQPQYANYAKNHFRNNLPDPTTLENVLILFGDRSGPRSEVYDNFQKVMWKESIGGNAGVLKVAINGWYNPKDGKILAFGNVQNIPENIRNMGKEFTFIVDLKTGKLHVVKGKESPSLNKLEGMQVTAPLEDVLKSLQKVEAAPAEKGAELTRAAITDFETGKTIQPWKLVKENEKEKYAKQVWNVYNKSYGKVGLIYDNPEELLKRLPLWYVSLDPNGNVNAFATFSETPYGKRLGLVGALPDSPQGKAAAKALIKEFSTLEGWYGAVSGRPAQIAIIDAGAPVVSFKTAQKIMGKPKGAKFSSAQRDIGKIKKMEGYETSPIVLEAAERTGKSVKDLKFEDLVEEAVLRGEIPNTPQAKENCYAIVQTIGGKKTVVIKVMVGSPIVE